LKYEDQKTRKYSTSSLEIWRDVCGGWNRAKQLFDFYNTEALAETPLKMLVTVVAKTWHFPD
jgi:hypothetical protein